METTTVRGKFNNLHEFRAAARNNQSKDIKLGIGYTREADRCSNCKHFVNAYYTINTTPISFIHGCSLYEIDVDLRGKCREFERKT